MLILTRKPHQSIMIGEDIIIKVMDIHSGQVNIGIEAPRDIAVHREETYYKIKEAENLLKGNTS